MFVDVKELEVSIAIGARASDGVWTIATFRLRIICCGSVVEVEDGAGEGKGLGVLADPVSTFPRSRSPIFGKSLGVGVQYCKRWG